MRNNTSLKLLFATIATLILTLLSALVINLLTANEDFSNRLREYGIGLKLLVFVVVVIALVLILLAWLQFRYTIVSNKENAIPFEDIEPDINKFFDSLKERYRERYESKLDGRFEIKLEVSEDWHGYKPKTYKFDAGAKISDAVDAVRTAFDEQGRLLIVGSPGSGKTVLLLNLALELLGDECKVHQKLPVVFNVASWSEKYESIEDWLIDVLSIGNGLSRDFAKTVLQEKRIIFLLDGLDELALNEDTKTANEKRARWLNSLNEYLREGRRAVICCRRDEFAEMQVATNQDAPVSAKVEVLDLTKPDILIALHDARKHNESRASAKHLEEIVDTNNVILEALSTPFYFTTALEVFDRQILNEKDLPETVDEIENYLIEKFVESKLDSEANPNNFERENTIRWLKWLAMLMEKKQLITFELADLQPTDLMKGWHFNLVIGMLGGLAIGLVSSLVVGSGMGLFMGLVGGLFVGFVVGLVLGLISGLVVGLVVGLIGGWVSGLVAGAVVGLVVSLVVGTDKIRTEQIMSMEFSKKSLKRGSVIGLVIGLSSGLVVGLFGGPVGSLAFGLFGAGLGAFVGGLVVGLENLRKVDSIVQLQSPYQRIYGGFSFNLVLATLLFAVISFMLVSSNYFIPEQPVDDFYPNPLIASLYGAALIPIYLIFKTPLFLHTCLRFCLWFQNSTPLKYTTFLEYSASLRILEKDGGQWRFRHQNLHTYFAGLQ